MVNSPRVSRSVFCWLPPLLFSDFFWIFQRWYRREKLELNACADGEEGQFHAVRLTDLLPDGSQVALAGFLGDEEFGCYLAVVEASRP